MSRFFPLWFLLLFAGIWLPGPVGAAAPDSPRVTPVVKAVRQAAPAVVNITSSRLARGTPLEEFFGPGFDPFGDFSGGAARKRASLGTGVIVDGKKGLILTNAHVIAGGDEIMVHLQDGRDFKARICGVDPDFDIAALEIAGSGSLPAVPIGDSADLMPGETVIAIGNPFGFGHTVTTGVVSALNRSIRHGNGMLTELIQTDAAINPGNSGGPLLNIEGRLIGINTAIDARGEGIGFAIPVNKARRVMEGLVARGKSAPLWLGVTVENVDQRVARALGLAEAGGALVTLVYGGGPAEKAGIRPGDVIRSLNGARLRDKRDFVNALRNQTPGTAINVELVRDGETMAVKLAPAPFDAATAARIMERRWGFTARTSKGRAVVDAVRPKGPAAFLRKGDIIRSIGQKPIGSLEDLLAAFHAERMSGRIVLLVERNGRNYYGRLIP